MFDRFVAFRAQQAPHDVAVSTPRGDVSFAQFEAAIGRVAATLADGRRPALAAVRVADPYLHWLLLLGLARLGAATASFTAGRDATMLPLLRPDLVVADIPAPDGAAAGGAEWLHVSPAWIEAALRRPDGLPARSRPADPAGLGRVVTSSGTTGTPKKFGLSWQQIDNRVLRVGFQAANSGGLNRLLPVLGAGDGSFLVALAAWSRGGAVLFAPPEPAALAATLPRLRPTGLVLAPIQLKALLDALPPGFLPLADLWIGVSGSHTPAGVRNAARARLTPNVLVAYASTEAGTMAQAHAALLGDDEAAVGWVTPTVELEVVDEAGRRVPPDTLGHIRVRGPDVVEGYLDTPDATAERFRDGWFYPGDMGAVAADGALRLEGRADDVMNFGGEKVLPRMMEEAALACPGVQDAGAFSLPDASGLPAPWLAVVRDEGLDEAALDRALRDRLPHLPPVRVAWIEAIPRNAGGKVERDRLRRAAAALRGN